MPPRLRKFLLSLLGAELGSARLLHSGNISGDIRKLKIGDNSFLNVGFSLHPTGGIDIGSNVAVGPRCVIITGTHPIGPRSKRAATPTVFSGVTIEDGCWLGAGVIVQPGVRIGTGCVVASGAVVVRSCEPDGLYAGVPASRIRELR
ncbi:acyltransferase [Rhodococcoides yunnanense]|uniref:acyltransferase n=1 Tax=Rhodococcoides yunnanense TaxID=278209 RepID=UPI001FE4AE73|nr:acyltransferase [Rhodococcus yunnanensis]